MIILKYFNLKSKMAAISSFLKLRQTVDTPLKRNVIKNHFVNELIQNNKNSNWLPGGHLVFSIIVIFYLRPTRVQDMCDVS